MQITTIYIWQYFERVSSPKKDLWKTKRAIYKWTPTHVVVAAPMVKSDYCKQRTPREV